MTVRFPLKLHYLQLFLEYIQYAIKNVGSLVFVTLWLSIILIWIDVLGSRQHCFSDTSSQSTLNDEMIGAMCNGDSDQ